MVAAGVIQFSKYLLGLAHARHHVRPRRQKQLVAGGLGLKPGSLSNSGPGELLPEMSSARRVPCVSLIRVLAQLALINVTKVELIPILQMTKPRP